MSKATHLILDLISFILSIVWFAVEYCMRATPFPFRNAATMTTVDALMYLTFDKMYLLSVFVTAGDLELEDTNDPDAGFITSTELPVT